MVSILKWRISKVTHAHRLLLRSLEWALEMRKELKVVKRSFLQQFPKVFQMFILFLIVVRSKLSSLLVLKWPRWFQKDSKERSWNLTLLFPPSKDFKEHKLESEENWIRSLFLFFAYRSSAHPWHLPRRGHGYAEGVHKESQPWTEVRCAQPGVPGKRKSVRSMALSTLSKTHFRWGTGRNVRPERSFRRQLCFSSHTQRSVQNV